MTVVQDFNARMLELVIKVGTASNETEARQLIRSRTDLVFNRAFLPAHTQLRNLSSNVKMHKVLGLVADEAAHTILSSPPNVAGFSGLCTMILMTNDDEGADILQEHFGWMYLQREAVSNELKLIATEFRMRQLTKEAREIDELATGFELSG